MWSSNCSSREGPAALLLRCIKLRQNRVFLLQFAHVLTWRGFPSDIDGVRWILVHPDFLTLNALDRWPRVVPPSAMLTAGNEQ